GEHVPPRREVSLQRHVVLDDAVVDHGQPPVLREVGVGVGVVGPAVRGPPGVAQSHAPGGPTLGDRVLQHLQLAGALHGLEPAPAPHPPPPARRAAGPAARPRPPAPPGGRGRGAPRAAPAGGGGGGRPAGRPPPRPAPPPGRPPPPPPRPRPPPPPPHTPARG